MDLIGIIWDATKNLCGCAKEEAGYIYNLEEGLQSLKAKWQELRSMKEDLKRKVDEAESTGERERIEEVKGWLDQVEEIQKALDDIQVEGAQEIQNKCLYKCFPKNCLKSYKLGKNAAKMLKEVDDLATKGQRFSNMDVTRQLPPKAIKMLSDKTVGLDLMFQEVWGSIEAKNVGIIGIYGMGGVGKTTLLKAINNKLRETMSDFAVLWVVVTKDHNLDSIMENIRKMVGIRDDIWNHCSSREEKTAKIYHFLEEKNFVLLLDDIWERFDLNMVGVPHPRDTNVQRKVLFTTRSKDVCEKMQAQRTFKVEILTDKEALKLFHIKVGEETLKSHLDIRNLAKEMAAECKGLPLALAVVGDAMAGVKSVEAWEHTRNNLTSSSWTALGLKKMFSILKFSYDWLPDETHKNCFLYCALYPKDYEIPVLDLIDKWIGEGFLGENMSVQDMHIHGESVIAKLKLLCLLESIEEDLLLSRTVKMHDVIRDMALWLVRNQNKNKKKILVQGDTLTVSEDDVETWKIVERISIIEHNELHLPNVACPKLITLMFASTSSVEKTVGLPYIHHMSRLKVMDLSYGFNTTIELPAEIYGLVLLEYLSLKGQMKPSECPSEVKNLKRLKFFGLTNLYRGELKSISSEVISSLEKLRVLRYMTFAERKKKRPIEDEENFLEELESLLNLEELWIQIKTKNGLSKVLGSTKLHNCIWDLRLEDIDTPINMPLLLAALSKMSHLHQLSFLGLDIIEDSSISDTYSLSMLRSVTISNCHAILHLTWLKYAPLLQALDIKQCKSMEEVIKGGIEDDGDRENVDTTFSFLVELRLWYLPKLKSIHKTALCFPSLRFIEIYSCLNLKKLPFDSSSAKDKLKHIRGGQKWWDNLEWEDPAIKDKFQSKFQA